MGINLIPEKIENIVIIVAYPLGSCGFIELS